MRRCLYVLFGFVSIALTSATPSSAQPAFVNGILIPGNLLDATGQPGANGGRFGFFSDIYYDPATDEWWALSDRGPGGGLISYGTRVQRFAIDIDFLTGHISNFRVLETVKFTNPKGPKDGDGKAMNGLNPLDLNGFEGTLGRSFDPEGLVIDPRTGNFLVADEYGPSLYSFDRKGRLAKEFETPDNLIPRVGSNTNYVALRDACGGSVPVPLCGATGGRQDNRGYEGLAVSPDGSRLLAVLQDPLINEPGPNNGRTGRNVRIIVFDNDRHSPTYGKSLVQYVYQLEPQADVAARINAIKPGMRRPPTPGRAATSESRRFTPSTTRNFWFSNGTTAASASTIRSVPAPSAANASTRSTSPARVTSRRFHSAPMFFHPAWSPSRRVRCSSTSPPTPCCPVASRLRNGKAWPSDRSSRAAGG